MTSRLMRSKGETVTVVRLSADGDEESIVAGDILCLISPVEDGQYENWQASLDKANRDIRKGDILRRNDGSELQIQRSVTHKSVRNSEKTVLDLKDYDRAEQPFQIDVVDALTDDLLPKRLLHHVISQKVLSIFMQGDYDTAVFQAFKQVEVAVRGAGGYEEKDRGTDLMRKAFHVDNGNLTDQSQLPAEKQARSDLFAGAIGSYKNPGSHRDVEMTAEEAAGLIIFASHLLRIVDLSPRKINTQS